MDTRAMQFQKRVNEDLTEKIDLLKQLHISVKDQ